MMFMEAMESLSESDLLAINKLTLAEMTADKLFTFAATFIDDLPTANGRIWSREWQIQNVEQFVGLPVTVNHENDQALVLGRVFEAEQKKNAIVGKVFIPLVSESNREAKAKIEAGLFKSVSINAHSSNTEKHGDLTRILPGTDDRVFEVSFVAVPGCKSCEVSLPESASCSCEQTEKADQWVEFAKASHKLAAHEYTRLAGFLFGESCDRETYESVASKLDPETLKMLTNDLRRIYDDREKQEDCGTTTASQVTEELQRIKNMKGV